MSFKDSNKKSNEVKRIIISNLIFAFICFFILIILESIFPVIKIPFKIYKKIYTLSNFSTSYLDLSKFFSYLLFLILGFAFVNIITLKKKRRNPLSGSHGFSDILNLIFFGFIIFFTSGNFLLLGKYDFDGFCEKDFFNTKHSNNFMNFFPKLNEFQINNNCLFKDNSLYQKYLNASGNDNENVEDKIATKNYDVRNNDIVYLENSNFKLEINDIYRNTTKCLFNKNFEHPLLKANFSTFGIITYNISLGFKAFCNNISKWFNAEFYFRNNNSDCKYPIFFERIFKNYFLFILPFIVGINFTYMDNIKPLQKFNLAWHDMLKWSYNLWILFFLLCLLIFLTLYLLFITLIKISILRLGIYLLFLLTIFIYVFEKNKREKIKKKHFHLHHYALMLVINLFLGVNHDFFLLLLGVFSGIMVEGACRWGVSSCWSEGK